MYAEFLDMLPSPRSPRTPTSPGPKSEDTAVKAVELDHLKKSGRNTSSFSHRIDGTVLLPEEEFWRDHQLWLKDAGYALRPRYSPDWHPSWLGGDGSLRYWDYEDGCMIPDHGMLDAICDRDGEMVLLKRVKKHSQELEIHQHLLQHQLEGVDVSGREYIVPIRDIIEVHDRHHNSSEVIVVFPYLRPCLKPKFETVRDVIVFLRQVLEGLQFIHRSGIAHGFCNKLNMGAIMMDPTPMYPEMHHPVALDKSVDFQRNARHLSRTDAGNKLKYYWVDFSRAQHIVSERAAEKQKSLPTLAPLGDPRANDIAKLRSMIYAHITQPHERLEFLKRLLVSLDSDSCDIDASIKTLEVLVEEQQLYGLLDRAPSRAPSVFDPVIEPMFSALSRFLFPDEA